MCVFPIGRVIPEAVTTVFVGGLPTLPYNKSLASALFFSNAYLHSHNRVTYLTSEVVLWHSDDDWRFALWAGEKGEGNWEEGWVCPMPVMMEKGGR